MDKIEVCSAFKIGHEKIDADHDELIKIIDEIANGYIIKDIYTCEQKWLEFCKKLKNHNINEEKIMTGFGYDAQEHYVASSSLLEEIETLGKECETLADWKGCFYSMRHHFLSFVLKKDLYFEEHLIKVGYKEF